MQRLSLRALTIKDPSGLRLGESFVGVCWCCGSCVASCLFQKLVFGVARNPGHSGANMDHSV